MTIAPDAARIAADARPAWRLPLAGFVVASLLLAAVGWITVQRMADLRAAPDPVQHTRLVRTESEGILIAVASSLGGLAIALALILAATLTRARALRQRERERAARATADAITAAVGQSEERLRVTIASIGDAVITTDAHGRVTALNPSAEALTGWTTAEAGGRPLDDVFVIVNEDSGEPAPNPVHQVLRDGQIAGLANHTLLIARDGRATPIDDSAAPIKTVDALTVGVVLVFRDITERRRVEQERAALLLKGRAAEERVTDLVESVPGVVWEAWGDPDAATQRMNFVSSHVQTLLGYSVDEWLRTPNFWLTIVHPDDREHAARVAVDAFATGAAHTNQFRWLAKDGRVVWVESRSAVIHDESGRPLGMRGVTYDITERKQAEADLALAKRQAEDANRLKDEFLAMVSHELRTPLNAILGWAGMLRSGTLPEGRRERAMNAIFTNAQREGQLIDELLDVSRIMSGKLRLHRVALDLQEVVRAAIEVIQGSADAKGVQIGVDVDPSIGPFYADATRLQQVLWNLLSNAVKFTPDAGAVRVVVRRQNGGVELSVTDTGQGIPAAFLPSVFEPFQQADGSTTRRHGGLGLGLSIVRHLVEAHGGTVSAASAGAGQGATFVVRLPLVAVYAEHSESESKPPANVATTISLEGLTILIVDDDAESRELVSATLEHFGATIVTASSAADALGVLDVRAIDVLISDVAMPGEDGYSLIRQIRAREANGARPLPAAALTSFARDEDRQQATDAGFNLHLAKPMDAAALINAVVTLVTVRGTTAS